MKTPESPVEALSRRCSQRDFAALVGTSAITTSGLVHRGILRRGATAHAWLLAYIEHLRNVAAGRAASGGADLAQERALLTREQREAQAMKNAVAKGTYAPIEVLTATISNAGVIVSDALEALPVRLAQALPDLPPEARKLIADTLDTVRNDVADKLSRLDFGDDEDA